MNVFAFAFDDGNGVVYTPWTDGHAVGFKLTRADGGVMYVYINPSTPDEPYDPVRPGEGSNVFPYQGPFGDPALDMLACGHHYAFHADDEWSYPPIESTTEDT